MDSFKKLSIQFKILLIPFVGAVGFCIYLAISVLTMNNIVNSLDNAYKVEYQLLQTSEFSLVNLDKINETLANAAIMGEEELLGSANKYADEMRKTIKANINKDPQNSAFLQTLIDEFDDYFLKAHELSKEMVDGTANMSTMAEQSQVMAKKLKALQEKLTRFQQERYQSFTHAFESVSEQAHKTTTTGIILGLITVALLFIVATPIALGIKSNLRGIIESMKNIAQEDGDLTVRLSTHSKDEIGDLVFWFNSFIEKLQTIIKDVVNHATPLAETATEIQALSNQTKVAFQNQSDSINQSMHSVGEMNQSVADITNNAAIAADSAQKASEEANNGQNVVENTVNGIRELAKNVNESATTILQLQEDTNKVNVVLEVIRGIAEQTNLLALNAAIEAARAGEQGRGFAVVADEVRSLASRTQQSTQEINQMLESLQTAASTAVAMMEHSQASVESNVESASKAGESLHAITQTVTTINDMNSAIAAATEEQNQVSSLMVGHVNDIQGCADEATGISNEIAQASDRLHTLAHELDYITQQFKV